MAKDKIMKITRRQLRRLISEAIKRLPVFEPVTQHEIDAIRRRSREESGIDPDTMAAIEELEWNEPASARALASSLGSERGEITPQQEKDFLTAQRAHDAPFCYDVLTSIVDKFKLSIHSMGGLPWHWQRASPEYNEGSRVYMIVGEDHVILRQACEEMRKWGVLIGSPWSGQACSSHVARRGDIPGHGLESLPFDDPRWNEKVGYRIEVTCPGIGGNT